MPAPPPPSPPSPAIRAPAGLSRGQVLSLASAGLAALLALLLLTWSLPRALPTAAHAPALAATLAVGAALLLLLALAWLLREGARLVAAAAGRSAPLPARPPAPADLPGGADNASASPLRWQIDLLCRLPGVGLLLQPAAGDWVVIALHRSSGPGLPAGQPWPDLPGGLSHERLQPLAQLLAAHPAWPGETIRRALADEAPPGDDALARRLPLLDGACIVWLPARGAPAPAATADATPLDERESIAYSVSHDLRAPIRVIEGFTRIVREDYGPVLDRIGNDHLDRVLGAAARMNGMIDALLGLARLSTQTLARQPVPLSQIALQIAQELQQQTPQRRVEFQIEPGLVAQGDPTLLRNVMENLLGNAWKYSARRETAHIRFGSTLRQRPADLGSDAAPCRVFEVSDDGAGFDMRFADRLFSPFQRLHSASEFAGNGVGLASVRRIVQRHGGEIWAEAEVDQGARFYFTLG